MNIAIITGASSGMGKEFARQLTEKVLGLDEVLVDRQKKRTPCFPCQRTADRGQDLQHGSDGRCRL